MDENNDMLKARISAERATRAASANPSLGNSSPTPPAPQSRADDAKVSVNAAGRVNVGRERAQANAEVASSREFTQNRELSDEEFEATLKETSGGVLLPNPPRVNGYHTMWAAQAVNSAGSYIRYQQKGYSFVEQTECPGYYPHLAEHGEMFIGKITYGDLVAVKISDVRFQMIMKHNHHDLPLDSERNIEAEARNNLQYRGQSTYRNDDGSNTSLGKARQVKRFEG